MVVVVMVVMVVVGVVVGVGVSGVGGGVGWTTGALLSLVIAFAPTLLCQVLRHKPSRGGSHCQPRVPHLTEQHGPHPHGPPKHSDRRDSAPKV